MAIPEQPARTVFDAINRYGHDEDFQPNPELEATQFLPGTPEKIEVLRLRVENGRGLWSKDDATFADAKPGQCKPRISAKSHYDKQRTKVGNGHVTKTRSKY
jgi:hypothetical protein